MFTEEDLKRYYINFIGFLLKQKQILVDIGLRNGLTSMQVLALLLLERPLPMNSLTSLFGCDASNVTGIVDGLQHKKLVDRIENQDDRRIRMVVLSDTGIDLRKSLLNQLMDDVDPNPIFTKLSLKELKTFFYLIDKIA